jgi:transposase-like protein
MNYNEGFIARQVRRMAGPQAISATALSKEIGVPQPTLSRWLRVASTVDRMSTEPNPKKSPSRTHRSPQEKLTLLARAAELEGEELGAFLRSEGLHKATLDEWRKAASDALHEGKMRRGAKKSPEAKRVKELERELRRKEKALAEMAALIALQKKLRAIWGDEEDSTDTNNET